LFDPAKILPAEAGLPFFNPPSAIAGKKIKGALSMPFSG
jgi:hypothetical protein